jgi:hypothetical protein
MRAPESKRGSDESTVSGGGRSGRGDDGGAVDAGGDDGIGLVHGGVHIDIEYDRAYYQHFYDLAYELHDHGFLHYRAAHDDLHHRGYDIVYNLDYTQLEFDYDAARRPREGVRVQVRGHAGRGRAFADRAEPDLDRLAAGP